MTVSEQGEDSWWRGMECGGPSKGFERMALDKQRLH